MEITKDEKFKEEIIRRISEREFSERTGVHQSDLVYCLNKQAFRKLYPHPDTASQVLIFSLGWATQRWLTGQNEDEPEIEVDGIKVTMDALYEGCPWELKATFQSNSKPIEENMHWIRQVMCQCYVSKTTTAYLSRLEIMGNWKWVYRPSKPEKIAELVAQFGENWAEHPTICAYRFVFSQEELDRHWEWMKMRRDQYIGVLSTGVALPKAKALASGQEFECEYCIYKDKCDFK